MKTILCFGDSITRGAIPVTNERYPRDIRYPGRLQKLLGEDYLVIEEGLNGRTCLLERKNEPKRNAQYYIEPCLGAHQPIDMVIVMLGTNDSLKQFDVTSFTIGQGMDELIGIIEKYTKAHQGFIPKIVLCCPPYIGENWENSPQHSDLIDARRKTMELVEIYEKIATSHQILYFNSNLYVKTSFLDSVHLNEEGHRIFAEKIAELIRKEF